MRRRLIPLLALAAAILGTVSVGPAQAAYAGLDATMTGAQEAPAPGDPDGYGSAIFTMNSSTGQICSRLHVTGIAPATAAHIHRAPPGVAGPVVITLPTPSSGFSYACFNVSPSLLGEIIRNPSAFYVNVHNAQYPGGAIRGQLD